MRVLFTPHAARQHLYPLVPLAWACRAAGHEVRIATAPALAADAGTTGLPVVEVGKDTPPPAVTEPGLTAQFHEHPRFPADWPLAVHLLTGEQCTMLESLGRNCARAAAALVDDLVIFARQWRPDVIVHDVAGFAGAAAAAVLGVPAVRHLTGYGLRPLEYRVPGPGLLPAYAELFDRFGVPAPEVPVLTLDPSPPSLRIPVPSPWREIRFLPFNGPGKLSARLSGWLNASRRPLVCVTWGHGVARTVLALGSAALHPFRDAIDAVAGLDVDVIVVSTAAQIAKLGDLPPAVRTAPSLPLGLVLPFCDLLVHQAGDGTTLTAAACGVPQLTVTSKPDQALTSDRLATVGAAIHLRYRELQSDPARQEVIRSAAEKMLTDGAYRQDAERLRAEIESQPTPAELVPVLAGLTTRRAS